MKQAYFRQQLCVGPIISQIVLFNTLIKTLSYLFRFMMRVIRLQLASTFSIAKTTSTIYALATGVNSAISIVRISGPESYRILSLVSPSLKIVQSKEQALLLYKVKPREMMLRSIFSRKKELIDRCLMVYFESEKSYSGQDIFELHLHGSKAIVSALFNELTEMNFKPAKRGQFTRRAFLNQRMNLIEAQAVNDLIHSELEFERQIAINNLMGKGSIYLQSLRKELIGVKMLIQSFIQFEEQQVGLGLLDSAKTKSKNILKQLKKVIQTSCSLQKFKEGVKISIVGRPNVGKSTLINNLVKKDVAIVSEIAGTTRDLIQSSLDLKGYRIEIVDTAGIRQSECEIQKQGIKRSRVSMEESNIVLVVIDISQSDVEEQESNIVISPHRDQLDILKSPKRIVIVNKIDKLQTNKRDKQILIREQNGGLLAPNICISARNNQQILQLTDILSSSIEQKFNLYGLNHSEIYFTRDRYIRALQDCVKSLQEFIQQPYADVGSYLVNDAIRNVEEIVGKVDSQEVLDQIFTNFCIGK